MSELPLTIFNRVGNDHDHYQKDHLLRECKHYDSKQNIADSIGYGDSFSFSKALPQVKRMQSDRLQKDEKLTCVS